MCTVNGKYLQALLAMHEDDFSKDIIKPLFEAMGYERVDFNGGPLERGRDLIAQIRIPPKREVRVTYIQSKKIGSIQSGKTSTKFSNLLHQLRQCCTGKVTTNEGNELSIDEVYLACPEPISNRLLEEISSQLTGILPKITPYDGPQILADIKKYNPDLLKLLSTVEDKLTNTGNTDLINQELLLALKSKNKSVLENFYSDLSFFVGSLDSNILLHLNLEVSDQPIEIHEKHWPSTKEAIEGIEKKYAMSLCTKELVEIESDFRKCKLLYESKSNTKNIKRLEILERVASETSQKIENAINQLNETTSIGTKHKVSSSEKEEEEDKISFVKYLHKASTDDSISNVSYYRSEKKEKDTFTMASDRAVAIIRDKKQQDLEIIRLKESIINEPPYTITLDAVTLVQKLNSFKENYINDLKKINNREFGAAKLKKFLIETEKTLSFAAMLTKRNFFLSPALKFKNEKIEEDRVSISPHDIFSAGLDIAVYGGAGVGKTTTLQAYANMFDGTTGRSLIYIPLNRLAGKFIETIEERKEYTSSKNLILQIILLSKDIIPSEEKINEARIVLPKDFTLMLDGLDEVYQTIPGILSAIKDFKREFKHTQLIISSRDCVSYLSEIDFLGITLLPFTESQLKIFIRGWIEDPSKSSNLINAIETKGLYHHIKTPLLATIACSLVENGIDAPSSENEIYSERLNLLTGEYDSHKNISRQTQKGSLLRKCARKIAFSMQNQELRVFSKEKMLSALVSHLSGVYEKSLLSECLEQLIDPCNLIIRDPISSFYSFGHFRFQEHLASSELKLNRDLDPIELVILDWWRGTLCLYAQENEISHFIEDTYKKYGNIKKAEITLKAMIENSPSNRRNNLRFLMKQYEKSDYFDDITARNYSDYDDNDF